MGLYISTTFKFIFLKNSTFNLLLIYNQNRYIIISLKKINFLINSKTLTLNYQTYIGRNLANRALTNYLYT